MSGRRLGLVWCKLTVVQVIWVSIILLSEENFNSFVHPACNREHCFSPCYFHLIIQRVIFSDKLFQEPMCFCLFVFLSREVLLSQFEKKESTYQFYKARKYFAQCFLTLLKVQKQVTRQSPPSRVIEAQSSIVKAIPHFDVLLNCNHYKHDLIYLFLLTQGGFARVYEVTDMSTNKAYALKAVPKAKLTKSADRYNKVK